MKLTINSVGEEVLWRGRRCRITSLVAPFTRGGPYLRARVAFSGDNSARRFSVIATDLEPIPPDLLTTVDVLWTIEKAPISGYWYLHYKGKQFAVLGSDQDDALALLTLISGKELPR